MTRPAAIGVVLVLCALTVLLRPTPAPAHLQTATTPSAPPPQRIISLIPAVTEMLFAIGAGPRVVGVSSFDRFPPDVEKVQRVGALLDPDVERILSLRPDLVAVYRSQTDLRQQLQRAGIPLFVYEHAQLQDVTRTIRELASRTGHPDEGARVAQSIENALAAVRERVAGRRKPRTLLVISREAGAIRGIYASGGFGFLHDMLETAGGSNVFDDVHRESLQATSEVVLTRRPEVILEVRGSPMAQDDIRTTQRAWTALSSIPAVRQGRIHVIPDERVVVPGPRVAEGTELLARALHPDAFRR